MELISLFQNSYAKPNFLRMVSTCELVVLSGSFASQAETCYYCPMRLRIRHCMYVLKII